MNIQTVKTKKINPAPYNPRIDLGPDDPRYRRIVASLDTFGLVEPLVWNKRTGHLVGGHQRFKVLVAQGATDAPVSVVDLPLEKEKALNLALNKVGGDWDTQLLAELLNDLAGQDIDLELTGFTESETEHLLANLVDGSAEEGEPDLDPPKNPVTKPGDIISLGRNGEHRILCGDCLDTKAVAKLLGSDRCSLCHTDPPYGVSYDPAKGKKPKQASGGRYSKLRNDNLTPKKYAAWFERAVGGIDEALVPGGAYYLWNSHANFALMSELLTQRGFKVSSIITWGKKQFTLGRGDYNEQTEFCLYGWKGGARHHWYGPKNASTLWEVSRDRLYRHPTQKALELAERAIRNSSKKGDFVFDPFLGGGTTLIAAARLGRRCLAVECEPGYCDVAVRRYIELAGVDGVSPEIAKRYGKVAK